ncbi:hypothetical protein ILUMI_17066 [Ignelater luminosus]|uniref:Major facilitator superfamily (MFS) profile domain-containing protein n=1 Tax=Ignelater luminosus TaxID=2038154 RepID=A0A8K0G8A1_IGNLU|nr:hypothetical protein ILUMI_17066 [Ignelater luminosus]
MILSRHNSMCSTMTLATLSGSAFPSMLFIKTRKRLYMSACTGNILALIVGLCFGWSSPYLPKLKEAAHIKENPLGRLITYDEASWLGSLLPLGAIFGTFIAGYCAQKIGRRKTMLFNIVIPFAVAFLIFAFADNIYSFYLARFVSGVTVSGVYTVVPMYLAEISEDEVRGFVCASIMTFETCGELIIYCIGPYVTIFASSMFGVCVCLVAALSIIFILPESPYYLLSINDKERAEKSLMKLRSETKEQVAFELEFMTAVMQEASGIQGTFLDLWKTKASRRAEVITLGLTIFQHWSGIVPVLLYSQSIFEQTGSGIPPQFCTMAVGLVQFLASFVTPGLVDKLGRRLMLFMSAMGMFVSEMALGTYFYMKDSGEDVSRVFWLPVACLVLYIVSYVSGFGPLIWTIMGEIFPTHLKAVAFSVGVFFWWSMGFVVGRVFYPISISVGMGGCFWLFSGFCFTAGIFILTYIIETKGKNIIEIQRLLNK